MFRNFTVHNILGKQSHKKNSIGVASGAALEMSISKGLQSMGVKKGTATTVASIVSTTVAVLV